MSKSRIEELEEENALLRYRLEEIEASIAVVEDGFAHLPKLSAKEKRVLALLVRFGKRSVGQIHRHLYAMYNDPPPEVVVRQFVKRIRKQLSPLGIEIVTHYGDGYELTPASIAILKRQPDASNCMLSPAQLSAFNAKCTEGRGEAATS